VNENRFAANSRLAAIRDSLLKIAIYYFISVSLMVASYIDFFEYIYEIIFLIMFLLIGLIFFFVGFEAVNSLMKRQAEIILNRIDKKIQEYIEKILSIASDGDPGPKIQETTFISDMLDVLQKQRDAFAGMKTQIYDLKSIISIIIAFFLPILTDIVKGNVKENLNLILGSVDIINQSISILNSSFIKLT
jgi:hypothetical protein